MNAWQLDKLDEDCRSIIEFLFRNTLDEAVEVRLDKPLINLELGGEDDYGKRTLHRHALGNTRHYLVNVGNPEWTVVCSDDEDWKALDHDDLYVHFSVSKDHFDQVAHEEIARRAKENHEGLIAPI